jgi:hypothetical protein
MSMRPIELRWRGHCHLCHVDLPPGETAAWDRITHELTCVDCLTTAPVQDRRVAREQVKALISNARAALDAARHAS